MQFSIEVSVEACQLQADKVLDSHSSSVQSLGQSDEARLACLPLLEDLCTTLHCTAKDSNTLHYNSQN